MAYDDGHLEIFRDALAETPGIIEKKMFGGICFMMDGNMLCGVHKGGGMFRVGKENVDVALAIDGARPMDFTGRPMKGFVDVNEDLLGDSARMDQMIALAKTYVGSLPPK